jgi:hypothetical protein
MAATTDFTVYSDHSDRHIGSLDTSSRHLVSRRPHRRCVMEQHMNNPIEADHGRLKSRL